MLEPLAPGRRLGHPEPMPDPEVPERPARRRFTAEYKLRIVEQATAATEPGAVGPLDEGLPMLKAPRVILTTHFAWHSTSAEVRTRRQAIDGVLAYLCGAIPTDGRMAVNPAGD